MWIISSPSRLFPDRKRVRRCPGAFTLIELLVSVTILAVIVLLFAQVIGATTSTIHNSGSGMSMDQTASTALDRIDNLMRTMVTAGNGTLVVVKNNTGGTGTIASDGLAAIANERVRNRSADSNSNYTNINVTTPTNIRLGAFGFCVMPPASASGAATTPILHWGDGTISFNVPGTATTTTTAPYLQSQPAQALMIAAADVAAQVAGGAAPPSPMLQFSPVNPAILRFEVCCLLSDGTIASGIQGSRGLPLTLLNGWNGTTLLPRNRYFVTGEALATPPAHFDSPSFPLAFSPTESDAAPDTTSNGQNVYVRAVVVGLAVLDPSVQKILSTNQLQALTGAAVLAKADGQTPLDTWDITSTTSTAATTNRTNLGPGGTYKFPPPVLQNIRFYQRYYYVN